MQPTAEGESQKVKLKVRVNIHGIVTVASASLVEKRQDSSQNENVEMENSNEASQDAPMDTNGQEQNGPDNQEVRGDDMQGDQQRQSWTQRVGQWFSGVCVGSALCTLSRAVCCRPSQPPAALGRLRRFQCFCLLFVSNYIDIWLFNVPYNFKKLLEGGGNLFPFFKIFCKLK